MVQNLHDATSAQEKLLTYLKHHRIWHIEALIWQWFTARSMPVHATLQQVSQLKTWLDTFRPLPHTVVSELRQRYLVRFTYHSNAIEGNTLTQSETELVLTTGITIGGKTLREHLEVIGHQEAMTYIEGLAQQSTPIREWEIRQIHNLILRKIEPEEAGKYRSLDVQAAGTGYLYPPHYLLADLMADFVRWLESKTAQQLHPVFYAAEAHYRFVSIHPFRDGNGRTGRLLMNLLLLRSGYPIVIISAQNRQQYIDSLAIGQQSGKWESFHGLLMEATIVSLIEVLSILVTASDTQNQNSPFHQEILDFLQQREHSMN